MTYHFDGNERLLDIQTNPHSHSHSHSPSHSPTPTPRHSHSLACAISVTQGDDNSIRSESVTSHTYLCRVNYLQVENLSKIYDTKLLFDQITFHINRGQKTALVARNGAGKSTLLKVIMGTEIADSGTVVINKEIRTGFLEQEPKLIAGQSIMENVFSGNTPVLQAIGAYEQCLEAMEEDHSPAHAARLEEAHAQMDALEAWDYEQKISLILSKLDIHHLDQPVETLSGGQAKRVALAKMLIQEPDLLILDEPTNHLDVAMIEWLEEYIGTRDMTMLVVTHDRYFLDSVCNQIIELEDGKLFNYSGNFSDFLEKKAHREAVEAAELDKARNLYRRELEWVRRMPKARTTKSKSRLDAFDTLSEKASGKGPEEQLKLEVKMNRIGGKILEMVKVRKAFGSLVITDGFTYTFKKGERVGIVGKNGVGKSTFLNMIMGMEHADSGKIQAGETIVFGYFSQEPLRVADDKRVIDVVKDIAEFIPMADGSKLSASQLLTRFLFAPETQYTFVTKLSGGEKRRLQLMTILIRNPNFLILDEPTNDLDILTLSILEQFLLDYTGCLMIVSHDRYFMDKLVDHLFVFEGDGLISDFTGNYTEYRQAADKQNKEDKKKVTAPKPKQAAEAVKKKRSFKENREMEMLEKDIAALEQEKQNIEQQLSSPTGDHQAIGVLSERLMIVSNELDEKSMRWLELAELE